MSPWDALTYLLMKAGAEIEFGGTTGQDDATMEVRADDPRVVRAFEALAKALGGEAS